MLGYREANQVTLPMTPIEPVHISNDPEVLHSRYVPLIDPRSRVPRKIANL